MLKPLLRTIPTLSGNVKLACFLTDYQKENTDNFSCYVRVAKLFPLSSVLSQRNIEANLLYSTYDYDLKKYFAYYSQYFYDDVFEYDKKNFVILDKTDSQKNRNTDFEFGCKRVSYQKNDTQFAFYAPIYVESLDDMPDAFNIHIKLKNDKYDINKTIKVDLLSQSKYNYLYIYLKKYLSKLDSNVIFCNSSSNQAVYYGIDLDNGGLNSKIDNIIAKIFNKQNTINNFDAIISNGFKRNKLAIKQIIPFCWYFNINDILSFNEKEKFKNSRVFITGEWIKDGKEVAFYDIDTNYDYLYENPYILMTNGKFNYINTGNNLLNMEYPSLNEKMYLGYRYSNKLNIQYNRWKLKYSDDEHPYITNLSPAFSINQGSTYRYGFFPEKYHSLKLLSDINNNAVLPIGSTLKDKNGIYSKDNVLVENYFRIMDNNCSSWYDILEDEENIYNKDIWNTISDDKTYYKGILFDFSKIYDEYPELTDKLDKFSILNRIHFTPIDENKLKDIKKIDTAIFTSTKYITDKTSWLSDSFDEYLSNGEFNKLPNFYLNSSSIRNGNSQLVFDKLFMENKEGDFIDMLSLGYDPYEINIYYKYSDIIKYIMDWDDTNSLKEEFLNLFTSDEIITTYFFTGYELLPIYKLNSILHENNKDIVFEKKDSAQWVLDKLYFSQHGNYYKTKYDRDTLKKLFIEYGDEKYIIPLYLEEQFISKTNLISLLYEKYKSENIALNYYNRFNDIYKYEYCPRMKDDDSSTFCADVFKKVNDIIGYNYGSVIPSEKTDNDVIYLDLYNMNNVIQKYNSKYKTHYNNVSNYTKISAFAKFLNINHLVYYISDLYKDEGNNGDIETLFNSLYIKKRIAYSIPDIEYIDFKDQYIHISKLYDMYRPLTKNEKFNILKGTADASKYANGIYIKTQSQYSGKTYKLCNVLNIDKVNNLISISFKENEYHDKDFYYKPTFYIRLAMESLGDIPWGKNDNNFIELYKYIKEYIYNQNNELYQYLSESLINLLIKTDIDNIDLSNIEILGIRSGDDELGFKSDDLLSKAKLKNNLKKIQKILNTILKNISDKVYYKDYSTGEYNIYVNYSGINDYIFLDDINMKKDIIKGNIDIPTFIINEYGEFIPLGYNNEDFYVLRTPEDTDYLNSLYKDPEDIDYLNRIPNEILNYKDYIKKIISRFATDIIYYESDNYYRFSTVYLYDNDIDSIVNIPDLDGVYDSDFAFEVVYKKDFIKVDKNIYDLLHIDNDSNPYKDLYLYRLYNENEYPSRVRIYYTTEDTLENNTNYCLYPLFDDVLIQDKEYSVIYSEYNQSNIYTVSLGNSASNSYNYRYNSFDIKYMLDISEFPIDKEYKDKNGTSYFTYSYWSNQTEEWQNSHRNNILKTFNIINTCYTETTKVSDDLGIYDKFNINTYTVSVNNTYTYTYTYNTVSLYDDGTTSYSILTENTGYGIKNEISYYTYGFIMLDSYLDNTQSSFNIVDKKYKYKKYFTDINNHSIYDDKFDINNVFNLMVPFSKLNILNNLASFNDIIITPKKYSINTHYKQNKLVDDSNEIYAYNINYSNKVIDTITLQRYFDNIVPLIKKTNTLYSSYLLKYKNYKYPNDNVNYINDVFYSQDLNIYYYDKLKVYDSNNSYTLFEPIEYKYLNDSKLINLQEEFEIEEPGTFTYDELLELEKEEKVIEIFKKYIYKNSLNTFDNNQILFLYNRYNKIFDTVCVGLNISKTEKIYKLKYKFKLY